jgi:pilus assembly protein CpaE
MRLLHKLLDGGESTPLAGFVSDDVTRQMLTDTAPDKGAVIRSGGPNEAMEWLTRGIIPKLLVVDLSGRDDPLAEAAALKDAAGDGSRLIALGQANDVTLYRGLLRLGFVDYLVKPVSADMLKAAIAAAGDGASRASAGPAATEGGRIALVVGARGGVGASTVATNAAWIMAEELDRRSALLDLDLQFGTSSLALNLAPSRGLAEALLNPDRIDQLFVASAMMQEGRNLSILSAEEALDRAADWNPAAVDALVKELRRSYEWIWIDLPRNLAPSHAQLLSQSSYILLVTELSLPAMRDTLRLLTFFRDTAPSSKVLLVANRASGKSPSGVTRQEFEKALDTRIDVMLPDEPQLMAKAATIGRPLPEVAKKSRLVEQLRAIDRTVIGAPTAKSGASMWRFLKTK